VPPREHVQHPFHPLGGKAVQDQLPKRKVIHAHPGGQELSNCALRPSITRPPLRYKRAEQGGGARGAHHARCNCRGQHRIQFQTQSCGGWPQCPRCWWVTDGTHCHCLEDEEPEVHFSMCGNCVYISQRDHQPTEEKRKHLVCMVCL